MIMVPQGKNWMEQNEMNVPTNESIAVLDQLLAMKKRELSYMAPKTDYLLAGTGGNPENPSLELQSSWRRKVCLWCFRVVDHFSLSREVVAISMSHYDRFLAFLNRSEKECVSSRIVSLVSLTTLYVAVKTQLRKHIPIKAFAEMSAGRYSADEIILMEFKILSSLNWMLNPPTQECFVGLLLELMQTSKYMKADIFERAQYYTEISLCDDALCKYAPSTIAFASILLAMEKTRHFFLPSEVSNHFVRTVREKIGIVHTSFEVQSGRERILVIEMLSSNQPSGLKKELASTISVFDTNPGERVSRVEGNNCVSPFDVTI